MIEKKETKEIVKREDEPTELQPQQQANYGHEAAKVLKNIVTTAKTSVKINGTEYLKFEAWQTIGKFYGSTVSVDWTKPVLDKEGNIAGFEAKASVIDKTGRVLSSAESSCGKDEKTWEKRANFQIRSMAQTRACSKALRNVYAWVVVLAGYQPTSVEEMDGVEDKGTNRTEGPLNITPQKAGEPEEQHTRPKSPACLATGCGKALTDKIYDYSMDKYGVALCYDHQKEMDRRQREGQQ